MIAYLRAEPTEPGGPLLVSLERAQDEQARAIERWATSNNAVVADVAIERAHDGIDAAAERVGFLHALSVVRDGRADAICIPSLEQLDADLVMQEMLLAEAARSGVPVVSAGSGDAVQLANPPADELRALVRRTIAEAPRFQGLLRSLRAWVRRTEGDDFERAANAMAALEAIQEHDGEDATRRGWGGRGARAGLHEIAELLRARRL